MKPFELIAALMDREKLGAMPLAKKLRKPKLQPAISRFQRGLTTNPERSTAEPLAAYFKIDPNAIYDERLATAIAKERGLTVVVQPTRVRRSSATDSTKPPSASERPATAADVQLAAMESELIETVRALDPERRIALMEFARHLRGQQPPRPRPKKGKSGDIRTLTAPAKGRAANAR